MISINHLHLSRIDEDGTRVDHSNETFTDDELIAFEQFLVEMMQNHSDWDSTGAKAAGRFTRILQRWKDKSN